MPARVRTVLGVTASLLFGWMVLLFLIGPTITYDTHDSRGEIEAECSSLIAMGWPNKERGYLLGKNGSGVYDDHIEGPSENMSRVTENGIYRDCDRRRTANAGFIGLLSVPTALLAGAALVPWRRADEANTVGTGQVSGGPTQDERGQNPA